MKWLRSTYSSCTTTTTTTTTASPLDPSNAPPKITISVECEKPNRPGLDKLCDQADVVFYSSSWAKAQGYASPAECLEKEAGEIRRALVEEDQRMKKIVLCCTDGADGACALEMNLDNRDVEPDQREQKEEGEGPLHRPAWHPAGKWEMKVIDTIGAGDTWIAGMLYGFLMRPAWNLSRRVEFANELAGRKVLSNGFDGLGEEMKYKTLV